MQACGNNAADLHAKASVFCMDSSSSPRHLGEMDATQHKRLIGWRLRVAIDVLDKSYKEVAEQFGINPSRLGNWMRGDDYPAPLFIDEFCRRYPITADWIYLGRSAGVSGQVGDDLYAAEQAYAASLQAATRRGGGKLRKYRPPPINKT